MTFELFRKVATTLWPGIYRVFGLDLSENNSRVFWSEPKRWATKSYADSWWYHLEKCLLWPFRIHLRFSIFGHFWKPLPFACLNPGRVVFTKFGHQPYESLKMDACGSIQAENPSIWIPQPFPIDCRPSQTPNPRDYKNHRFSQNPKIRESAWVGGNGRSPFNY